MADTDNRLLDAFASTLGVLLHLALLPIFLVMGLVVPAWFVGVLLGSWVALVVVAIRKRADERYLVLAPIVAVVAMIVVIAIGENALDWTA